jgi:predicted NBD/HSP70 family sugar kinase
MIAGIDLGGTQVRVALARSDGHILSSARTRTALLGSPERLLGWAAEQVARRVGRHAGQVGAVEWERAHL